jgi:hypothetical protein
LMMLWLLGSDKTKLFVWLVDRWPRGILLSFTLVCRAEVVGITEERRGYSSSRHPCQVSHIAISPCVEQGRRNERDTSLAAHAESSISERRGLGPPSACHMLDGEQQHLLVILADNVLSLMWVQKPKKATLQQ